MKSTFIAILVAASAMLFTASPARADHTNTNTNAITCDFTVLAEVIDGLELSDVSAPNNNARRGRLNSLNNALENATEAAEDGDIEEVLDALEHIAKKSNGKKNAWISGDAADDINDALDDLLDCLEPYVHDDDDDDDEEE